MYFINNINKGVLCRAVLSKAILKVRKYVIFINKRQLFDYGVRQVGHGVHDPVVRQIDGPAGLDPDFHFKITSLQIDEDFAGRDQRFHQVDPGCHGLKFSEPDPQHGRIRLGELEHLKFGAHDPRL